MKSENIASEKIAIFLPSRIGDSILSLPAAICLEQLNRKYKTGLNITVYSKLFLVKLLSALNLFSCKGVTLAEKLKSYICPPDRAFFIETTNANFGFRAKTTYGTENPYKKFLKFTHQPVFHRMSFAPFQETWDEIRASLPEELVTFLLDEIGLSYYSAALFGIPLELGFTAEQIIETFKFSPDIIPLDNFSEIPFSDEKGYYVFCAEAGYGRKHLNERCWDIDKYFKIADKMHADTSAKMVFTGVNMDVKLSDKDYIVDMRGTLNLYQLACLMKNAKGYIGNDTGPLHVANLMRTPSVAAYFQEIHMAGFGPIFGCLNKKVLRPQSVEEMLPFLPV